MYYHILHKRREKVKVNSEASKKLPTLRLLDPRFSTNITKDPP